MVEWWRWDLVPGKKHHSLRVEQIPLLLLGGWGWGKVEAVGSEIADILIGVGGGVIIIFVYFVR